jgi:hypothetical protein
MPCSSRNYRVVTTFNLKCLDATPFLPGKKLASLSRFGPVHCAGSELVVLVFEQDVERGERSVTARDILLQVELVRIAQLAWHAVASAKEGRSRSPSARELADYSES